MKRLFLVLITTSAFAVEPPPLPERPQQANARQAYENTTNTLPSKDKEKLDMLLKAARGLEGNNPNANYKRIFSENWNELRDQIDRASSGMSLSGWTSGLSRKDRIIAIRNSVGYILHYQVSAGNYIPTVRQALINDLSELISFANLKLSKL